MYQQYHHPCSASSVVKLGHSQLHTLKAVSSMPRPPLSDASFLSHVFHPKRDPQPTGLRKRKLEGLTGRKPARLRAYNNMTAVKQEILKRSGLRDAYLKGESTLVEARRKLRIEAINLGVAKPVKSRRTNVKVSSPEVRRNRLKQMIALHLGNTVQAAQKQPNWNTIDEEIDWLDEPDTTEDKTRWSYGQFKYAAREGSEYDRYDARGRRHNPFFYH